MDKQTTTMGKCLCGAVRMETTTCDRNIGVCHCSMCRNWTSGPFFTVDCGQDLRLSGEENITRYHSSEWGDRAFCNQCGTTLFYHFKPKDSYFVSVGLFADKSDFVFEHEIFIDEKPSFYDFANDTKKMTGEEVMAMEC